jgi:hypothetical protein
MTTQGPMVPREAVVMTMVLVALGLGAAVVSASWLIAVVAPTMLALVALTVLVLAMFRGFEDPTVVRKVLRWTLGAFVLHLMLSVVIHSLIYAKSDALTYHDGAVALVQHWKMGFPSPSLPHGKEGFYYLLGALFWVFGVHNAAGLVINAMLAAALVPIMTDLTRRWFGQAAAAYVPVLVVLLPGLLLWTSQLLKEAVAVFLISVAVSSAARLAERVTGPRLITMGTAVVLLFTIRSYVGLLLAAGVVVGVVLGRRSVLTGFGTGLGVLALFATLLFASGVGYSGYKVATTSNLQQASLVRQDLAASANTGFGSDVDISTPGRALSYLPVGAVSFLFGPFPWQLASFQQVAVLPDVLVSWCLLPSLWRGARAARHRVGRTAFVLALPALAITVLFSLVVGNYGAAVRERIQVVVVLVPVIALGLAERNRRSTGRQSVTRPQELAATLAAGTWRRL